MTLLKIDQLKLADDNVRTELGDLRELTASIKQVGVLEPLLVREGDNLVVCGSRRLEAAKKAGLKEVPVLVRPFTEQERVQAMVIENLQRRNLTPLEEAAAFRRLQEHGLTQAQIAAQVGIGQGTVSKRLALLDLPESAQKAVKSGAIALEHANALTKLRDDPKLVEKVVKRATGGDDAKKKVSVERVGAEITQSVDRETAKRDLKAKVDKVVKQLRDAGEEVLEMRYDQYGYSKPPKGTAFVKETEPGYAREATVVAKLAHHKTLPCHAVGVDGHTLKPVEMCTAPKSHPDPAAKRQKAREAQERKDERELAQFQERTERRQRWLIDWCQASTRMKSDAVIELAFIAVAGGTPYRPKANYIAQFLGLEPEDDWAALDEFSEKSAANRMRLLAATCVTAFETGFTALYAEERYGDYLAWVVAQGYDADAKEDDAVPTGEGVSEELAAAVAAGEAEEDEPEFEEEAV